MIGIRRTVTAIITGMLLLGLAGLAVAQEPDREVLREEVENYLDEYTQQYLVLRTRRSEAQWAANTRIIPGDTTLQAEANAAAAAFARFTGSVENIKKARGYLEHRDLLTDLQVKQLEKILYVAANNPQTVPEVVAERIAAETAQVATLYGFDFNVDGEPITTNRIDRLLVDSRDLDERLAVWRASKEVGVPLKPGLAKLVKLRNATVRALGYDDFFQYQVSDYGMSVQEMRALLDDFNRQLRPLYRELHTWARYELAERYGEEVPEMIPAHWLPNRWGQDWQEMVSVEGLDLNAALEDSSAEFLVRQAERFYVSLGMPPLPDSFYELSSLYPLPADAKYKKNNHASAWHINLSHDVRSLMSVEPNASWWETTHHELGHVYYYLAYTNEDVPPLLRGGANRSYHEAIGSLLGLASMHEPFLREVGMVQGDAKINENQRLLKEALNAVVFIPWSAGVMTAFEQDLYDGSIDSSGYNSRWWEYKRVYQGIAPPEPRGEQYCDPASKTHINNDAAQYYDYAISYVLLYHLHDYIAREILEQDPRATNYFGSEEAGQFLWSILEKGATGDWRTILVEKTGEDLSAEAMLDYFAPLMEWLREQNEGREHTLPALP